MAGGEGMTTDRPKNSRRIFYFDQSGSDHRPSTWTVEPVFNRIRNRSRDLSAGASQGSLLVSRSCKPEWTGPAFSTGARA